MRFLAIALAFAALPAAAQNVVYQGALDCEAAPSANIQASNARATVTRAGNQVTFERPIYHQQTRQVIGREAGTGTLDGGRFVVQTEGNFGGNTMRGRYEGSLADHEAKLTGTRQWTLRSGVGNQSCSGTFRPQRG
ncbi:hypothetical protein [Elioraea rosea]|uniref:hypothetical protein n=1 Tax=Elioraea rosea TaxID=2492390 RepID=UPI001184EA35|nr:hypothetical protein [Elioraea rosea]